MLKDLAFKILERNRNATAKQQPVESYATLVQHTPFSPISDPEGQHDFCDAHGDFNGWRGQCPVSLDDCLLTKIIEADNLDHLRGLEIGRGITTDMVIDAWVGSGEPPEILLAKPTWFVCMAEYLFNTNGR